MAIKPIDVRRKEFKNSLRGYNADEVDDFLDTVADEFEHAYTENLRMREEISSLRDRLEQFEKLEGSIQSALVHAESAANDLREGAAKEADNIRNNANREADLTIKEAQERSQQTLADSSSRVERAQESYEALKMAKQNFGADFRHLLRSYIDVMDNVDIVSAKDIEASLRERLDWEAITAAREAASESEAVPENAEHQEESQDTQQLPRDAQESDVTYPEPEVEEPEVEPSSVDQDSQMYAAEADNDAAGEVEDEETTLDGEERDGEEDSDEVKASRASRFLRKRD